MENDQTHQPDQLTPEAAESSTSNPELDQLAGEAAALEAAAAGEAPPPGSPGEPAPALDTAATLQMMLTPAFGLLAPNWKVSKAEIGQLADAYAAVLDKYFPDGFDLGPELGAVVATLAVFGPRASVPRVAPPADAPPAGGQADASAA